MSGASEAGPLLPALASSILALGGSVLAMSVRRIAGTLVACLIVIMLLAVSLAFLTLSGYRAILASVGPVYAPLIVGFLFLVAGLVAALVVLMRRR